jgi:hypothetical protein
MESQFCGACGAHQTSESKFCVNCGAPQQAPPYAPASPPAMAPAPRRPTRRGLVIAAAGLGGVLAIGAGVAVGLQVFGGGGGADTTGAPFTSQRQVVAPVASQPTEAWTWQSALEDGGASVVADGDLVVVVDAMSDQTRVARLDADGEEAWENSEAVWVNAALEDEGLVYVSTQWEGPGVAALDADTGEEIWRNDDLTFLSPLGDGRVVTSSYSDTADTRELAVLDDTGVELWTADFDDAGVRDGQVVSIADTELTSRDAVSGEVSWEVDTGLVLDEESYTSLAVTDELVVVSAGDTAVGFDPDSGEELWRENPGFEYGVTVAVGGPALVYTYEGGDSESYEDGEVVFLGVEGILERRPLDSDECCYSGFGFRQGGEDYFASTEEGIVYDEDLTPVAHFDGQIVPTSTGFYETRNGELSYHLLDGTEEWSRQVGDPESYVDVIPLDGRVLVAEGATITAYE